MMASSYDWSAQLDRAGVSDAARRGAQLVAFESDILRFAGARNLVSRRDPELRLRALLAEAIQAWRLCRASGCLEGVERIADLGSGAGIPGIPWAILRDGGVDLLERRIGRAEFLERELRALPLPSCRVHARDARHLAAEPGFEPYAFVLAKAVAQPMDLLGWVGALLRPAAVLCLFGRANAMQNIDLAARGWSHQELALGPDPAGPDFPASVLHLLRRSSQPS